VLVNVERVVPVGIVGTTPVSVALLISNLEYSVLSLILNILL
jgi:hypothetical protein